MKFYKNQIDIEYQKMIAMVKYHQREYVIDAEITSSQVTSQISEFVTSKPPEEWQESYINYMDAMKKFNSIYCRNKSFGQVN